MFQIDSIEKASFGLDRAGRMCFNKGQIPLTLFFSLLEEFDVFPDFRINRMWREYILFNLQY